ncbi:S-layer homology domain-containing protein [Faecousia sp.]|uniref:S-layer homology domain-containing protein n=1 Tax=Faecousia sp. TaxID=2952921 RepID=UPI002A94088E|nr:S-layer homology domain-containing protein [Candidatus Faecousia sp.]
MKRILSILLVLAMLLSMIPAVFAANCDITVSTPAPDPVKVGALYQLPLGTVFTDPNGHALSFALKADYGDKVYIKDNTLQFTSAEAGEFRIGITATCTDGGSAEAVVPITVEAVEDGGKNQYGYDETDQASVTVYVTISSDGAPIIGKDDGGTILSHLEVKVPYFPLSLYGLDDFNRYHTENGSGSYTDNEIVQRPTLLHLYIYMLERYYLGVAEKDCGKGTSGLLEFTGSGEGVDDMLGGSYEDTLRALLISGSATSMYMQNFWGHDENLMYYRNHVYPLMSAGWGSTADYILLSDNDTIDLAMFSNWSFWTYGAFARFDKDDYTAKVGEKITFETQKYDTKSVADGGTESFEPITGLNVKLYNENWEQQQELTSEGSSYTLDTASLKAGTYYLLGYDPNYGTENACYAPATAKVVLTSEVPQPCQWDEGVVTTEPTCTTAGVKTFSCSVHGETRTEELPALGHTFGAGGQCIRCGEKAAYLSALRLTAYNGSGDYDFTPEFDGKTAEYQVAVPDADGFSAFLWATLSENAPEGSIIKAEWTNLYNGKTQSTAITSGKTSGQSLANFSRDAKPNTVTLTVGVDGNTQTYTLTSFRTPTLSALNVTGARMNETFSHRTAEYTIDTTADSITLSATPYQDGYTVTYNGAESGEWTLQDGENVMTVVVSNADGLSASYTVKATKHAICKVRAELDPENALLVMYDSFNTSIYPDENGDYALMDGAAYTYVATAKGYVGKSGSLTASAAEPVLKITLTAAEENTTLVKDLPAEWPNFRNGSNHLGITNAPTPYTSEDSELLWAAKYGTGWAAAPGSPILVDGGLITYTGSTIKRLDVNTGKVLAEGTMAGTSSFSINPATYADGMIFVGLSGGKIQAFNAKTLESLWIYTDPLGGQPNTSPTYHDGYIYVGFWNGESKPGNFVAISVTDEDPMKTDEAKLASWSYACVGGFYWAGAYVTDNLCIVGTDDGSGEGDYINTSALLVFDRLTGKLLDSHYGCKGDIRSNVSHDPDSDRVFFTSKGGYIYNAAIDWETGRITDFKSLALKDAEGYTSEEKPGAIMSTCTPSVYNGRIYLGVSGNKGQFSQNGGHCIEVIDLDVESGEMSYAYSYGIVGYPQTSAMVSTAYVDKDFDGDGAGDGYVFIYLPYNYTPGGISVLMDRPGQTEPKTATDSGYSEIFTPESPLAQYCICSTIADSTGTIYYKNDSCYMMAITSKILSIEVTKNPEKMSYKVGETFDASGMKVVAKLANGLERDITNYVTWQEGPIEQGQTSITLSYTYGFDSANYGLKTKTAELELDVLPSQDEDGVYLIGNASQLLWFASKVNSGETGISGKLTANIDLASVESWTPMGSQKQPFTGSFDGDGHSITGMSITFDSDDKSIGAPYLGLFGYVKGTADKKAEIKNLTLTGKLNITENYRNSYAYSGGLVGGAKYVSFTDVTVDVAVTAKQGTASYPWSYIGGFAGTVTNADFLRCANNGTVTSDGDYVSGFVPKSETTTYTACANNGAITGRTKIGGLGAEVKSTKVVDSCNTGAIGLIAYGTGKQAIGGLFAEIRYGSSITRSYNSGAVTGDCYVGGLVGSVGSSSDATNGPSYIVDSYNFGAITGHSDKSFCGIGGLVGKLDASSSRVYEQSYVHNCYNAGTVTDLGLKTAGNPGAAIGVMHADYSEGSYLEVKDVYYRACGLEGLGMMVYSTMHDPSVFVEMSAESMKASGFVTKLGASFKADGTCMQKVNGGYPILVWQKLAGGQSEHTLEETRVVAPTCTKQGYTIYTCTACGDELKADFVPATGHSYEASVVAPTCEKDGYTNHVCSVCGDSYRDNYVDAAGHQYTDTVTAPTCTASGYTTHTCSVCGHSYINSVVPATGHDYVWQITRVPTCTAEGVKTFTCSHCGDSYDVALAKADHTYEAVVTAPTCTNNGYTTHTCSVCGDSYVDSIVPATGHSYEAVVTVPTCDKMGYTTYTCSVCGDSYVGSYTDALEHTYTAVVTKEPTCTEEGVKTFTCSECGKSYTEAIPTVAHRYEAVVTAPTCDKMGYTTYTCSACGDSYVADYVDAAGHDCETETVPATCLGYGFVRESCKHCDYSVITEITAPLGHDYQAVVTAPTLDEGGYTTHTCSRCGDSYVDSETLALGHKCAAYTDIPTDWAKEGICFVIENGLMVGTTSTTFAPKDTLTRAMLVTVLYRMAGSPAVDAPSGFTDVADGQWYSDAIAWAAANGIVNGVGGNKFAPSEPVTREQLAAIFFRYAKAEAPEADMLSGYPDAESVSTYARDAMAWAVSTGLVTGSKEADGTYLVPQGLAAREQAAAILMRYVKANA